MTIEIRVKRVYDAPEPTDGIRVLVDRLWPRGIKKEMLNALWLKEVAPSTALRTWYHQDYSQWAEFKRRYLEEMREQTAALAQLRALAEQGPLTLIYSSRQTEHNHALLLREILLHKA